MAQPRSKINPYHRNQNIGVSGTPMDRALVVSVDDPLKQGRVKIRVVGHMDDEMRIPDDKLPWVKVMHGTNMPSLQTSIQTSGLLPGSMVMVNKIGDQDYTVMGTLPNDRGGENQSQHPAAVGGQGSDLGASGGAAGGEGGDMMAAGGDNFHPIDQTKGWTPNLRQVALANTTMEAKRIRDQSGRQRGRKEEPVKQSQKRAKIPKHYGERSNSKDLQPGKSGTIGTNKFDDSQDSQKFIDSTITNKSAVVNSANKMIQSLKKVQSNPKSKESVGSSNFAAAAAQLASMFGKGGQQQQQQQDQANTIVQVTPEQCATGFDASYGITKQEFDRQCSLLAENQANTTSNTGIRIVTLYDNGFAGLLNSFSSMVSLRVPISNGTLNNASFVGNTVFTSQTTFNQAIFLSNVDVNAHFRVLAGGANIFGNTYVKSGGLVVGNPTGGMKAAGSINAQFIYDDNTQLSCYVFDAVLDGYIDTYKWDNIIGTEHRPLRKFIEKTKSKYNPLDLNTYIDHWREKRHLTSLPNENKYTILSTGEWIQRLIETVELQAVHDRYLLDRIQKLENRIAELETNVTR